MITTTEMNIGSIDEIDNIEQDTTLTVDIDGNNNLVQVGWVGASVGWIDATVTSSVNTIASLASTVSAMIVSAVTSPATSPTREEEIVSADASPTEEVHMEREAETPPIDERPPSEILELNRSRPIVVGPDPGQLKRIFTDYITASKLKISINGLMSQVDTLAAHDNLVDGNVVMKSLLPFLRFDNSDQTLEIIAQLLHNEVRAFNSNVQKLLTSKVGKLKAWQEVALGGNEFAIRSAFNIESHNFILSEVKKRFPQAIDNDAILSTRMISNMKRFLSDLSFGSQDDYSVKIKRIIIASILDERTSSDQVATILNVHRQHLIDKSMKLRRDFDEIAKDAESNKFNEMIFREKAKRTFQGGGVDDDSDSSDDSDKSDEGHGDDENDKLDENDDDATVCSHWTCRICKTSNKNNMLCSNNNCFMDFGLQVDPSNLIKPDYLPKEKRRRKALKNNIFKGVLEKDERAIRDDKLDPSAIDAFIHGGHPITRIDTCQSKRRIVIEHIDKNGAKTIRKEDIRILQCAYFADAYIVFLNSEYHQMWLDDNPREREAGRDCSIHHFRGNICPCVKKTGQIDTADEKQVTAREAIMSWLKLRQYNPKYKKFTSKCNCLVHGSTAYQNITSETQLLEMILCPKLNFEELRLDVYQTEEQTEAVLDEKIKRYEAQLLTKKRKRTDKMVKKLRIAIPSHASGGPFMFYSRKCCSDDHPSGVCEECDRNMLFICDNEFNFEHVDDDDALICIDTIEYKNLPRGKDSVQREQVITNMSLPQFKEHFRKAMDAYLPHYWASTWISRCVSVYTQKMRLGDVVLSMDFSAQYEAHPQYRLNTAIPTRLNQLVIIVKYTVKNANGNLDVRNIAYGFWSDCGKSTSFLSPHSSYVHLCVQYIINDLHSRGIDTIYLKLVMDGCASQFKSKFYALACDELIRYGHVAEFVESVYFPTAAGKGEVDSIGNTKKQILRMIEITLMSRIIDAVDAVTALDKYHKNHPISILPGQQRPGTINEYVDVVIHDTRSGTLSNNQNHEAALIEDEIIKKSIRVILTDISKCQRNLKGLDGIMSRYCSRSKRVGSYTRSDNNLYMSEMDSFHRSYDRSQFIASGYLNEQHYICDQLAILAAMREKKMGPIIRSTGSHVPELQMVRTEYETRLFPCACDWCAWGHHKDSCYLNGQLSAEQCSCGCKYIDQCSNWVSMQLKVKPVVDLAAEVNTTNSTIRDKIEKILINKVSCPLECTIVGVVTKMVDSDNYDIQYAIPSSEVITVKSKAGYTFQIDNNDITFCQGDKYLEVRFMNPITFNETVDLNQHQYYELQGDQYRVESVLLNNIILPLSRLDDGGYNRISILSAEVDQDRGLVRIPCSVVDEMYDSLEIVRTSLAKNEISIALDFSKNINSMKVDDLKVALKHYNLDLTGIKDILKNRLQSHLDLTNVDAGLLTDVIKTAAYSGIRLTDIPPSAEAVEEIQSGMTIISKRILGLGINRIKAELNQHKVKYDNKASKDSLRLILHNHIKSFQL